MRKYYYRCYSCKTKWESENGAFEICPNKEICGVTQIVKAHKQEGDGFTTDEEYAKREESGKIWKRITADNYDFDKKYKDDPYGWKRAGYVKKGSKWNQQMMRYELFGSPEDALTNKGRRRPNRQDI